MILRSTSKSWVLFDFLTARAFSSSKYILSAKRSNEKPRALPSDLLKSIQESVLRTQNIDTSAQQADIYNSILVKVKRALGDGEPLAIHLLWIQLKQHNLVRTLDPKLLSMISNLFTKSFIPDPSDTWDPSERETVEDVAVAAASFDAEGAAACMLYHIKRNDPETALSLYARCSHVMTDREAWDEEIALEGQEDLAETSQSSAQPIRGRVYLLLAATTAHALIDAFQNALEMCKNTDVRFHNYTTREFLENLQHDPALRDKVDLYVRRLHLARLVSRPPSLSKQITNLGDTRALVPLKKLYDAILDGIRGQDPFIAADESSLSSNKIVSMTEVGWTSFLTAFLKCSAKDVAAQVWDDIGRMGIPHKTTMWNALIMGQAQSFSDATTTFEHMKSQNVQPNALTYRALIGALFNGRRPNLAMDRFRVFQSATLSDPPEDIMSVYNTVLNGLLVTNRVELAFSFFQQMEANGPKPDVVSYNTFLGHYARRNDLRGLGMIMNKMGESSVAGDVFTFSTILSALLKMGREDAPEVVFRLMGKQDVKPNTAIYTAMIDHQMRERDETHLNGALKLLSEMEADSRIAPNIVTYTAILAGVHRGTPWLSRQKEEDFTRSILKRMARYNIKLNTRAYNILIKSCLNGHRLDQAVVYYEEMKRTRTTMFHETWYILLEGLIGMKEWDVAKEVVNDMKAYGVRPLPTLQKLVNQAGWHRTKSR